MRSAIANGVTVGLGSVAIGLAILFPLGAVRLTAAATVATGGDIPIAATPVSPSPNVWTTVTPTYVGAPNGGQLTPMTWQVSGAYDPVSKRTITTDRWSDSLRGNTIYSNGWYAYDPSTNTVEVLKLNNWKRTGTNTGGYTTDPLPANNTDPTPVDRHPLGGVAIDPTGPYIYLMNGANQTASAYLPLGHPNDTWRMDIAARTWRKLADGAAGDAHPPIDAGSYGGLVYDVPTHHLLYFAADYPRGTQVWEFDTTAQRWSKRSEDTGSKSLYPSVANFAYDTKRNRTVMLGGGINMYNPAQGDPSRKHLRAYSTATNQWTELAPPPFVPYGTEFAYDSNHDIFLALFKTDTYIYNPTTNTWAQVAAAFARGTNLYRQTVTYNPASDVFVFAGGSWDKPVWAVFRYSSETTSANPPPASPAPSATAAPAPTPTPTPAPPPGGPVYIGSGCTTAWFIDEDCDGYGVGVRSSGTYGDIGVGDRPDADDTNPALNTAASVRSMYDANHNGTLDVAELRRFLSERKNLTVTNVYYIAPGGNDATGAVNDPSRPYATYPSIWKFLQPGDAVIYRGGTYDEPHIGGGTPAMKSGTPGKPIVIMAAPGEQVTFTTKNWAFATTSSHDIVVDGFAIDNPANSYYGSGFTFNQTTNAVLRNIEAQRFSWVSAMQDLHNITVEHVIIHHNREHGLYMGSRELTSSNVTVKHSILYRNGIETRYGAIQFNGRVTHLVLDGNILHSNGQWGISLKEGVTDSILSNNVIFNNQGNGIIFDEYPGDCFTGGHICPYTQTGNLVTNNTIWIGRYDQHGVVPIGGSPRDATAILVGRNVGTKGDGLYDQGHNTFQNNILFVDNGPAIRYTTDEWLDTTTVRNNVVFRTSGPSPVVWYGAARYSFSNFQSASWPLVTGNVYADPLLATVNIDDYGTPDRFRFDLSSGSPAIGRGVTAGAPPVDLRGARRAVPIDAGAYDHIGAPAGAPRAPAGLRIIR
jgi:parallel beta-helix repeat protein